MTQPKPEHIVESYANEAYRWYLAVGVLIQIAEELRGIRAHLDAAAAAPAEVDPAACPKCGADDEQQRDARCGGEPYRYSCSVCDHEYDRQPEGAS